MQDIIKKQLMDGIKSKNILLEEAQIDRIIAKLTETVNYIPKIGKKGMHKFG